VKEFELTMRLRNNLIKKRRLAMGLTPRECSKQAGLCYGLYLRYEGLKESPLSEYGEWHAKRGLPCGDFRPSAKLLAAFFGVSPEDLFPDAVLAVKKPEVVAELEGERALALGQMAAAIELPPTPEDLVGDAEIGAALRVAMGTLTPREQEIIQGRYFDEQTLRDVGEGQASSGLGVSRERIRQVEVGALRKLREAMRGER